MHVALKGAAVAVPTTTAAPAASSHRFGALLEAQRPDQAGAAASGARPARPARLALDALERSRAALDAAVAEARNGRTFSPSELLALQSQAYRYGQTVELASKVVEQAAQAVKQAVNTQV